MKAAGSTAVMAARAPDGAAEGVDAFPDAALYRRLNFFPTPPWATRALVHDVLAPMGVDLRRQAIWEPAAGLGHMSTVLAEDRRNRVWASDVHPFARDAWGGVHDFLDPDARPPYGPVDWIITNPPFKRAEAFARQALRLAGRGVALLVRLQFLESAARWRLFRVFPPAVVAVFSGRVAMTLGGWDPGATTATAYCWVVWARDGGGIWGCQGQKVRADVRFETMLIAPDAQKRLTRDSDSLLADRHAPGWVRG